MINNAMASNLADLHFTFKIETILEALKLPLLPERVVLRSCRWQIKQTIKSLENKVPIEPYKLLDAGYPTFEYGLC